MKERPIIFSAPMVRAILDGSKTQTRRVVKPQPNFESARAALGGNTDDAHIVYNPRIGGVGLKLKAGTGFVQPNIHCKLGQPGDLLYVKETFRRYPDGYCYRADFSDLDTADGIHRPWSASIHMPRWASRITLEITDVRVERLCEISDADAIAESVDRTNTSISGYASERFKRLWKFVHGKDTWQSNPWVWVISFRKV